MLKLNNTRIFIIYACVKDRVTQTTDANVGKGATVRVNIDKEGASGVKRKKRKTTSDVLLAVTEQLSQWSI